MTIRHRFFVLAVLAFTTATAQPPKKRLSAADQTEFSAEDTGIKKPIVIPEDVLSTLRKDEDVRHILESEDIPLKRLPFSWFSASAIHLCRPDRTDPVVVGEGRYRAPTS